MTIQEITILSEKSILAKLGSQKALYSPLEILSVKAQPAAASSSRPDAKITLALKGRKASFFAEVKARTAPKIVAEGLWRIKKAATQGNRNFMLVVPYLSPKIVELLNEEGVSGMDISGNYLIQTPAMVAVRLDQKNRYPESVPIKKIYSSNSSLVARLLLSANKQYNSVNDLRSQIETGGGSLSLSAVSKVLKGMEDDLIIEKKDGAIRLLQPDKLLQKLQEEYLPPKIIGALKLKFPSDGLNAVKKLKELLPKNERWALSGESSASRYAIMADASAFSAYTTSLESLSKYEDERFYNVLIQQTDDSFPYFDSLEERNIRWASPIQCFLELSQLGKREKEAAGAAKDLILKKFK